jgi:release factor glutamine methyltransferase
VENTNALIFYKAIIDFSKNHLRKEGFLFFEINEALGEEVSELLLQNDFGKIELRKDLSGKDRMVKAQKN